MPNIYYQQYRARGQCVGCGEPAQPGRVHCVRHMLKQREANRARRLLLKAAGLCERCKQPWAGGTAVCPTCTHEHWLTQKAKRQARARLMAAAPDLLAAAKLVASFAQSWRPLSPGDIQELTRAIAKAEGRDEAGP